jgi:hypothetical protein
MGQGTVIEVDMARVTAGEVRIAYDVLGGGPQSLVVTHGWVSHLDYDWSTPEIRGLLRAAFRGHAPGHPIRQARYRPL